VEFVVDKMALGQVFSQYFHQTLHRHNHPGQVSIGQKWPTRLVDPDWTPFPTMRIKEIIYFELACSVSNVFFNIVEQ
jgi:hypothetical protein